ncbi:DMT family transporter [Lacipirellula parvula]|uniref:Permease n=1 Tax=Lacipirellula parvula TaxID=2650471 RepID=A0A5K7XD68_9BACT|nr:DMT family transporter [Lacipirellula parvula]BBO32751.1 permease [Lacipirellula parvula]
MTEPTPSSRSLVWRMSRQELVLLVSTIGWGGTFLATQKGVALSGPLFFVGLRFLFATLFMLAVGLKVLRGMTRHELIAGGWIGLTMYFVYALQTAGLQTISSSKSAFITALYVPIVPLLQWAVMRKPPRLMSWIGIALAFTGLMLLAGPEPGSLGMGRGEVLTLLGTFAIAVEIILIGHFAPSVDSRRVTLIQCAVTAVLSWGTMPVLGESLPNFSWTLVIIAAGLGLVGGTIQLAMNWAQRSVSPTRATLIYSGEPVWAGIVGRIAGERLPMMAIVGALLIVAGVVVSELRPRKRRDEEDEECDSELEPEGVDGELCNS